MNAKKRHYELNEQGRVGMSTSESASDPQPKNQELRSEEVALDLY